MMKSELLHNMQLRDYIASHLSSILESRNIEGKFIFNIFRETESNSNVVSAEVSIIEIFPASAKDQFTINLYDERKLIRLAYRKLETLTIPDWMLK